MLCSVLKSTKLSSFKGVHFEVHLRVHLGAPLGSIWWVHILYLPEKTRHVILVTMESELTNMFSLLSYLMSLIAN